MLQLAHMRLTVCRRVDSLVHTLLVHCLLQEFVIAVSRQLGGVAVDLRLKEACTLVLRLHAERDSIARISCSGLPVPADKSNFEQGTEGCPLDPKQDVQIGVQCQLGAFLDQLRPVS